MAHNADFGLARLCYLICRALKPSIVLETGVAYGLTTAVVLKALDVNGTGLLHSVDLPPLGSEADQFVGRLIPQQLRHRWRLHRGASRRVLPSLLPQLGQVDIFVHDSLHTLRNMRHEFRSVMGYLSQPGVVIADDVDRNPAFLQLVHDTHPAFWATSEEVEKKALFGVSVYSDEDSTRP
jgi:hypothetical protein